MICQLENRQIPDIIEVIAEVSKIRKLVDELYDRLFVPASMVIEIESEIEVEKVWSILVREQGR